MMNPNGPSLAREQEEWPLVEKLLPLADDSHNKAAHRQASMRLPNALQTPSAGRAEMPRLPADTIPGDIRAKASDLYDTIWGSDFTGNIVDLLSAALHAERLEQEYVMKKFIRDILMAVAVAAATAAGTVMGIAHGLGFPIW